MDAQEGVRPGATVTLQNAATGLTRRPGCSAASCRTTGASRRTSRSTTGCVTTSRSCATSPTGTRGRQEHPRSARRLQLRSTRRSALVCARRRGPLHAAESDFDDGQGRGAGQQRHRDAGAAAERSGISGVFRTRCPASRPAQCSRRAGVDPGVVSETYRTTPPRKQPTTPRRKASRRAAASKFVYSSASSN